MNTNSSMNSDSTTPWIGKVPQHWSSMRLKDCVDGCVNGIWGDDPKGDDTDTPVIRVADFDRLKRSTFPHETTRSVGDDQRRSRVLLPGDLLIEKSGGGELQPVGMVVEYKGVDGAVCSNFVARMRPREFVDSRYLTFLHAHMYACGVTTISIKQSTGIQNLDSNSYLTERCHLPPLKEQLQISSYLDKETKRIDSLIEGKNQLLKNLDQLFDSAITEAVTFGLDPNVQRRSEPEHSLFNFPSHWLRCGLIKKIESIVDYRGKTPEKTDSGVFLVTARNIAEGWIDYGASAEFIAESAYEEVMSRGKPKVGDVLFTTEAPLGKVASIDRTDIALAQRIIKFRADSEYLDNNFLKYWLMSGYMQDQLKTWSSGSTAEGIKASRLRRLQILVPPLHEQTAIVEFIEKKLAEVRGLKLHVENELLLLSEYRSSTITDAVLGRIDVQTPSAH